MVDHTIKALQDPALTRKTIKPFFANLTIGAGSVAAIVSHKDLVERTPLSIVAAAIATNTNYNHLCEGDNSGDELAMLTDSEALLEAGIDLAKTAWSSFQKVSGWTAETPDRIITHQVGKAHTRALFSALEFAMKKITQPLSF